MPSFELPAPFAGIFKIFVGLLILSPLIYLAVMMGLELRTLAMLLLVPYLLHLLFRLLTIGTQRKLMMQRTGKWFEPEASGKTAPGAPPAVKLAFWLYRQSTAIPLTAEQQALLGRAMAMGRETWRAFKKGLLASFASLLVLCVVSTLILLAFGQRESFPFWLILPFLILQNTFLFLIVLLTYGSLRRVPPGLVLGLGFLASSLLGFAIFYDGYVDLLGLALVDAAGAWVFLRACSRLDARLREEGDRPLLVLRVFDADANTVFLFGEILRRWQWLGSFATIADASYSRFETSLARRETRRHLWIFLAIYFLWVLAVSFAATFRPTETPVPLAVALDSLGWQGRLELATLATALLLLPVVAAFVWLKVRLQFRRTSARFDVRSPAADDRVAAGHFRGAALYCHDDVWRRAVASQLPAAAAVLMDLRGFSPERRGCEYELRLLLDRYPIGRVLLLVDEGPHQEQLFDLLRGQWERLAADSPNREIAQPILRAYAPGIEDPPDIEHILALLVGRADRSGGGEATAAVAGVLAGKPDAGERRHGHSGYLAGLDLLLSTRAASRLAIPAICVLVAAPALFRLAPSVGLYRELAAPRVLPVATCAEKAAVPSGSPPEATPAACPENSAAAPAESRIVVDQLASLLPDRGWVRLAHPALDRLGEFDLVRTGPSSRIQVRARGDLERVQVYFAGLPAAEEGEEDEMVPFEDLKMITLSQPGLFCQEICFDYMKGGAWLEIGLAPLSAAVEASSQNLTTSNFPGASLP